MRILKIDDQGVASAFNNGRGKRRYLSNHVRVKRGRIKTALKITRRSGHGKLASGILLPKNIKFPRRTDHLVRNKKDQVCALLRAQTDS